MSETPKDVERVKAMTFNRIIREIAPLIVFNKVIKESNKSSFKKVCNLFEEDLTNRPLFKNRVELPATWLYSKVRDYQAFFFIVQGEGGKSLEAKDELLKKEFEKYKNELRETLKYMQELLDE